MSPRGALAAVLVIGVGLSACAPLATTARTSTPTSTPTTSTPTSSALTSSAVAGAVSQANRTHEYPSPRARERALAAGPSPVLAVAAFAVGYINWTARTVSGRMQGLAALSVGQARALVVLTATQTARDYELQRSGVANAGSVEAISPMSGRPSTYVVVTRERTTATATDAYRGLAASWHVALATVVPDPGGGWVVSGWQPES